MPEPTTAEHVLTLIRELHTPYYETKDGVRHDHVVFCPVEELPEDHACKLGDDDPTSCSPDQEEHYVLACVECRGVTEDDIPGYALWPCPTVSLLDAYAAADELIAEQPIAGTYPCCRHCANPCAWALRHGQHDRPCPHCAAGCTCRMDQTKFGAVIDPDCPVHEAAQRELEYDHDDAPVPWRTRCTYVHADHDGPCEPRDREA